MAATIKTKIRTTTGGTASTTAGELCVNTADKKIFIGDGAASVDLFGNLATTAGKLSQFAATTSAELAGVVSDETGSGSLVFGTSPSISTLVISTTGTVDKTAAINMAQSVTATNSVTSEINLYSYNADDIGTPPAPTSGFCSIRSDIFSGVDLRITGSGDPVFDIVGNIISIGDVVGAFEGTKITVDASGSSVDITGKLKPDQLVWENDGIVELVQPGQCPIYMKRWNSQEDDPVVYTYPFYVDWVGTVTASAVITPYLSSENGVIDITGTLNLNGHNVLPLSSVVTTAAALSNVSTAQNAFPVGQQTLTVAENTTYLIEGEYVVNSGTTTHTTAIGFSVAGDLTDSSGLEFSAVLWSAAASTITTAQSSIHVTANANTQTVLNATSTAAVTTIKITGVWNNTTNTTITPKIKFSALPGGTNQMAAGSYIRFTPIANPTNGLWA